MVGAVYSIVFEPLRTYAGSVDDGKLTEFACRVYWSVKVKEILEHAFSQ